MPFKERSVMEARIVMIMELESGLYPVAEIAARHGVSRETVYVWARRKAAGGVDWFKDESRAPLSSPWAHEETTVAVVVALRKRFPHFGPKKLVAFLSRQQPKIDWPSASTAGAWLSQHGLIGPRKRRVRVIAQAPVQAEVHGPNDEWAMDFKGWFRTSDGARCDPLTVSDMASRYLLETRIVRPNHEGVKPVLEGLFREVGLPLAIRSDNGPPFATGGPGGLSRLAVWLLKLDIEPRLIRKAKPQDNGCHERMHRTLKAQTSKPPADTLAAQQKRFDVFRRHFNEERPHEAHDQQPPALHWTPSSRALPNRICDPWYDADHQTRRVRPKGEIKWKGAQIFIGEALAGEVVGITEREHGGYSVRFATRELGVITPDHLFHRFAGPPWRPGSAAEQMEE
jgi:transposase InsO family protein